MVARMKMNSPRLIIYLWVYIPLAAAVAAAGLAAYVLLKHAGPPDARLLLEAAGVMAFLLGLSSWGSVVAGAQLLADDTRTEPIKLREAGWLLGGPIGLLAGVLLVLHTRVRIDTTFVQAYAIPMALSVCVAALLWAAVGRVLARAAGLSFDDYACGLLLPRDRYLALKEHKQAMRQAPVTKE